MTTRDPSGPRQAEEHRPVEQEQMHLDQEQNARQPERGPATVLFRKTYRCYTSSRKRFEREGDHVLRVAIRGADSEATIDFMKVSHQEKKLPDELRVYEIETAGVWLRRTRDVSNWPVEYGNVEIEVRDLAALPVEVRLAEYDFMCTDQRGCPYAIDSLDRIECDESGAIICTRVRT